MISLKYYVSIILGTLLLISGSLHAAGKIELRDNFWTGKEFRISGQEEWRNIGSFGENLRGELKDAPQSVLDQYNTASNWRIAGLAGASIAGAIIGWNLVEPSVDWNIAWASLGIGIVAYMISENTLSGAVRSYNAWQDTQATSHMILEFGPTTKVGVAIPVR